MDLAGPRITSGELNGTARDDDGKRQTARVAGAALASDSEERVHCAASGKTRAPRNGIVGHQYILRVDARPAQAVISVCTDSSTDRKDVCNWFNGIDGIDIS